MYPVAVLAGGLATRLYPVTHTLPKALLEIAGEPFLAHQLRFLRKSGISHVVICAGYLDEQIKAFMTTWKEPGLSVDIVSDGTSLRGTAGALRHALPFLGDAFFVLYGDCYVRCDFARLATAFQRSDKPALMAVYRNPARANVQLFADGSARYNKFLKTSGMQHRDYGLSIASANVFSSTTLSELADVYHQLDSQLGGHEIFNRPYEIGSFDGIAETDLLLCHLSPDSICTN